MNTSTKNFHFQELDLVVSFPLHGNQGKYAKYTVTVKKRSEPEKMQKLSDILESQEFEQNYPYTVRYYKSSSESIDYPSEFLAIREIRCLEDFWVFLSSLDI